jgi:hypothetical protein
MNITEIIDNNSVYIILGLAGVSFLLLIFIFILSIKQRKLNKKYKKFMTGASGENLEGQVIERFADIDKLKADTRQINDELAKIKENLLSTYQKVGVVKYDAFKEMGGKLSFVLALLDKSNNGFLLNSVHSSREGCYTYLKEIIKGESFLELSDDEKKALNQAVRSSSFME